MDNLDRYKYLPHKHLNPVEKAQKQFFESEELWGSFPKNEILEIADTYSSLAVRQNIITESERLDFKEGFLYAHSEYNK